MATPQSIAADDLRTMADVVCRKAVREDYESGYIPRDVGTDELKEIYRNDAVDRIISDDVWEEIRQRIEAWKEQDEETNMPVIVRLLKRFPRFPTVARVEEMFGMERASEYRNGLEVTENLPNFPTDRHAYPWRKFEMDAAVSAVVKVVAPHINDEAGMSDALTKLVGELRARRRERSSMDTAELNRRKNIARSLGIWFPMAKDLPAWRSDPRTQHRMKEFLAAMSEVTKRMRLVRSYLQYIPRRRLSARACADMHNNIERMKAYLRGFDRASKK